MRGLLRPAPVVLRRRVVLAAPADRVWDAIVDWSRHAAWVPLTSITVDGARPPGIGARFTGRTALGRIGFDDVMEVTEWRPPQGLRPGRCEVVKRGRLLTGRAWFEVAAVAGAVPPRTEVTWVEEVGLAGRGLPAPLAAAVAAVAGPGLGRVLAAMARDIETEVAGSHPRPERAAEGG